jgi:hypothetical protein
MRQFAIGKGDKPRVQEVPLGDDVRPTVGKYENVIEMFQAFTGGDQAVQFFPVNDLKNAHGPDLSGPGKRREEACKGLVILDGGFQMGLLYDPPEPFPDIAFRVA